MLHETVTLVITAIQHLNKSYYTPSHHLLAISNSISTPKVSVSIQAIYWVHIIVKTLNTFLLNHSQNNNDDQKSLGSKRKMHVSVLYSWMVKSCSWSSIQKVSSLIRCSVSLGSFSLDIFSFGLDCISHGQVLDCGSKI